MGVLYSWCDRLLAIGSENAAFYRAMGVSDQKIFLVPYSVDNERFVQSAKLSDEQRSEVRKRYNIPVERRSACFTPRNLRRASVREISSKRYDSSSPRRPPIYGGDGWLRRARAGAAHLLRRPRARQRCIHGLHQPVGIAMRFMVRRTYSCCPRNTNRGASP